MIFKMNKIDPRYFQILFLGILLFFGVLWKDFSVKPAQVVLTFASGILTHFLWVKILKLNISALSSIVTCCGLSILLRSDNYWVHPLIVFFALSSKFLIRIKEKHLFNPAMIGVLFAINFLPGTWISPGQWGSELVIALFILLLGLSVTGRAGISTISFTFLLFYLGLLFFRVVYYGYIWDVFFHQIKNGTLLLFSFFMISDPKTSPDHKYGRILHCFAVAFLAHIWTFYLFKTNGLVWGLFFCSILIPIFDSIWKEEKYEWNSLQRL